MPIKIRIDISLNGVGGRREVKPRSDRLGSGPGLCIVDCGGRRGGERERGEKQLYKHEVPGALKKKLSRLSKRRKLEGRGNVAASRTMHGPTTPE